MPRTGIGHYTFELARSLALLSPTDDFHLISPFAFDASVEEELARGAPANLRGLRPSQSLLHRRWWAIGLPLYLRQARTALFHGTNYEIPLWGRQPAVVTIHDLSILLHADKHLEQLARRARRRLPLMARKASKIITATESVKREICEHLRVSPDKIAVTPYAPRRSFRPMPPPEAMEARRRLGVEDEFILFVGTIEPRKNLLTLARAFDEIMRRTEMRPQLVICGREGWLLDELYSFIEQSGIRDRMLFTGYVAEDDLRALYSSCLVTVYPSLYEGFGLPPLEAMACGAPVITSNIQTILETVGEAALAIPPTDHQGLARAILTLMENEGERRRLAAVGLKRAAEFSWEKTARLTLEVYKELLGRR